MAIQKCLICGKEFYAKPNVIKKGFGKYCSKNCFDSWQRANPKIGKNSKRWNSLDITCKTCGIHFFESPSRVADGRGKYCSRICYVKDMVDRPGHPMSEKTRIKLSKKRRGVLNPAYKDGGSRRYKTYHSKFSNLIREKIRIKYNHTCQGCGSKNKLHVHHKDFNPLNNNLNNFTLLCINCHAVEHANHKRVSD